MQAHTLCVRLKLEVINLGTIHTHTVTPTSPLYTHYNQLDISRKDDSMLHCTLLWCEYWDSVTTISHSQFLAWCMGRSKYRFMPHMAYYATATQKALYLNISRAVSIWDKTLGAGEQYWTQIRMSGFWCDCHFSASQTFQLHSHINNDKYWHHYSYFLYVEVHLCRVMYYCARNKIACARQLRWWTKHFSISYQKRFTALRRYPIVDYSVVCGCITQ